MILEFLDRYFGVFDSDLLASLPVCLVMDTGGKLVDFYDGADHIRPFSQTPKYVDQIFQRHQIC